MARFSYRDRVRNLTQPGRFSNRALAAAIGVHEKTIRRWKSGERDPVPGRYHPDVFGMMDTFDKEVRRIERAEAKRAGYTPPSLPVQFPSERVEFIDPLDPKKTVPSDVVAYDLEDAEQELSDEELEFGEIFQLLKVYRDRANLIGGLNGVRFLVRTLKYKEKGKTVAVTYWWPPRRADQPSITGMSDEDLKDMLVEIFLEVGSDGDVLKLRVQDALLKRP